MSWQKYFWVFLVVFLFTTPRSTHQIIRRETIFSLRQHEYPSRWRWHAYHPSGGRSNYWQAGVPFLGDMGLRTEYLPVDLPQRWGLSRPCRRFHRHSRRWVWVNGCESRRHCILPKGNVMHMASPFWSQQTLPIRHQNLNKYSEAWHMLSSFI